MRYSPTCDSRFRIFNGMLSGASKVDAGYTYPGSKISLETLLFGDLICLNSSQTYQDNDPLGNFWEQSVCAFYAGAFEVGRGVDVAFSFFAETSGGVQIFLGQERIDTVSVTPFETFTPFYEFEGDGETPLIFILRGDFIGPLFISEVQIYSDQWW